MSEQTTKQQIALGKLDAFHSASMDLLENWHECLDRGYPFKQSFDEWIAHVLNAWTNASNLRYPFWVEFRYIKLTPENNEVGMVAAVYEGCSLQVAYATFDVEDLSETWTTTATLKAGYNSLHEPMEIAKNSIAGAFRKPMSHILIERLGLEVSQCL